jgi:hypothetical protein
MIIRWESEPAINRCATFLTFEGYVEYYAIIARDDGSLYAPAFHCKHFSKGWKTGLSEESSP